jgi:hypothetical protein
MKEQIKQTRVRIDGLSQLVRNLKPFKYNVNSKDLGSLNSDEVLNCINHLLLAKAWLGKMLGELGEATPYANDGKRKSVEDIEAAADRFKVPQLIQVGNNKSFNDLVHVEKVDWLRQEIKNLVEYVQSDFHGSVFNHTSQKPTREFAIARTNAYTHLCEARFHLGFELQRIKEGGIIT